MSAPTTPKPAATPQSPHAFSSAILLPALICLNCGNPYRPVVHRMNNGKVTGIDIYCDHCYHGAEVSMSYVNAVARKWHPPAFAPVALPQPPIGDAAVPAAAESTLKENF